LPEERRSPDPMLIEIRGNMEKLLERSDNHKDYLDSVSDTVKSQGKDISDMKSHITGLKFIGSLVTVLWTGIIAVFFKKL
jgi:archaellum component FlaC